MTHTGGIGEAPMPDDLRKAFDKLFAETDPATPLAELYAEGITIEVPARHEVGVRQPRLRTARRDRLAHRRANGSPTSCAVASSSRSGWRYSDLDDQPHPDLSHGYSQAATPQDRALLDLLGVELESDEPVDGYNLPGKFVRVWGNGGAGAVQSTVQRHVHATLRRCCGQVAASSARRRSRR